MVDKVSGPPQLSPSPPQVEQGRLSRMAAACTRAWASVKHLFESTPVQGQPLAYHAVPIPSPNAELKSARQVETILSKSSLSLQEWTKLDKEVKNNEDVVLFLIRSNTGKNMFSKLPSSLQQNERISLAAVQNSPLGCHNELSTKTKLCKTPVVIFTIHDRLQTKA